MIDALLPAVELVANIVVLGTPPTKKAALVLQDEWAARKGTLSALCKRLRRGARRRGGQHQHGEEQKAGSRDYYRYTTTTETRGPHTTITAQSVNPQTTQGPVDNL
jgi:hypothetical protein